MKWHSEPRTPHRKSASCPVRTIRPPANAELGDRTVASTTTAVPKAQYTRLSDERIRDPFAARRSHPPSRTVVVATSVRPAAESTVLTAQNTECQQADICANPGPSIAVLAPPTAPRASSPCAGCCPGGQPG